MTSNLEQEFIKERIRIAARDYIRDHSDELAERIAEQAVEDIRMNEMSDEKQQS